MRRPRFSRWIRNEVLRLADVKAFSLRKLTAYAQREGDTRLRAALVLYAHENNHVSRFSEYLYDEEAIAECKQVESRLGSRSVERLALRGTPMMSLPEAYREILSDYVDAYYAPERIADEKRSLWEATRKAVLLSGSSPMELSRALQLDPANMSAYLARGDINRFTLSTAQQIARYVA